MAWEKLLIFVRAPTATEWADAAGTINYEIITRLGPRIEYRTVGGR